MAAIQWRLPGLPGNDSYYHVRMAQLLPEIGFAREFPWLHWTIFRDDFVSHHHGFHVVLAPLVWASERLTGSPGAGARAAPAAAMAATTAALYWALGVAGVRWRGAWVVLLALAPWQFWMRQGFVRAPIAALPLLLAAAGLALRGRAWGLALVGFLFAHVYGGAVLFPLVPGAMVVGALMAGDGRTRHWRHLAAGSGGLVAGLILNPYFPQNFAFLFTQLFRTGLAAPTDVGVEWSAFDAWYLTRTAVPLGAVSVLALALRLRSGQPLSADGLGLLVLNLAFLLLTLKARRFVEYWPPFALLSAAQLASASHSPAWVPAVLRRRGGRAALAGLGLGLALTGVVTLRQARAAAGPARNEQALQPALAWLAQHTPAEALVFTDDWDNFPICFYHNTHNRYMVGLDPVFTAVRWPALWERYRRITRGRVPSVLPPNLTDRAADAAALAGDRRVALADIRTHFGAQYVLVLHDHPRLYALLSRAPDDFVRVFPAGTEENAPPPASVFRVRDD